MTHEFSVGDTVLYIPAHAHISQAERGVITSMNDFYIFVRYGDAFQSQATRATDLRLEHPNAPT